MADNYIPEEGDIVWMHFDPQAGHEQAGHRPALVLSPSDYNRKTGLMICCPMTTKIKSRSFEVFIKAETPGAVLSDQVKNMDWRHRQAKYKNRATPEELAEVRAKIFALIG